MKNEVSNGVCPSAMCMGRERTVNTYLYDAVAVGETPLAMHTMVMVLDIMCFQTRLIGKVGATLHADIMMRGCLVMSIPGRR
jgi:hypothetical protein